jgi:hypothetical protein
MAETGKIFNGFRYLPKPLKIIIDYLSTVPGTVPLRMLRRPVSEDRARPQSQIMIGQIPWIETLVPRRKDVSRMYDD